MNKEWNAVEILRHSRHDWLNKLQLIKGNIALNRMDRVNVIIEEIIMETKNEAKLTNLSAEQLTSFLLMFNWQPRYFTLEFEIIGDGCDLSRYDEDIYSWCSGFFSILNESVQSAAENHLCLSIQITDEEVRFFFDFSGILEEETKVLKYIEEPKYHSTIKVLDYEVHRNELVLTLKINT